MKVEQEEADMEPMLGILILMVVRLGVPIAILTLVSLMYSRAQLRHTH
jgi:hypothetical protein